MKSVALTNLDQVENAVSYIKRRNLMYAIDLETTGINPFENSIVGIGFSVDNSGGFYIPFKHRYDQPFDGESARKLVFPLLLDYQFCAFNAVFELEFLEYAWGLSPKMLPVDTSLLTVAAGVWDVQKLSLVSKDLCPEIDVQDFATFMKEQGLNPNKNTIDEASVVKVADYCIRDTTACMIIYNKLYEKLREHPTYKLEAAVMPVVQKMRQNGVLISEGRVRSEQERLSGELAKLQELIEDQVSSKAGERVTFNIGSGKQLGDVLFDVLKLPCERYTPKGARKTDKETLSNLKWHNPIVRNIITFKEISKLLSTYYVNYLKYVNKDGKIHASYNQTGVVTGRFSCNNPNLQNIPRKNTWDVENKAGKYKLAANFRDCFDAPSDCWFVEFDYSQIEARLMAGVTKDPVLVNAFASGIDYHTKTASEVFDIPVVEVTKEKRYMGKLLNFALGYGMGEDLFYFTLRKEIEITHDEASYMRKKYLSTYKVMFDEAEKISIQARRGNCVETIWGRQVPINLYRQAAQYMGGDEKDRRKRFKLINDGDRMAYNAVIQGSGADLLKMALVKCDKAVTDKYKDSVWMILTTHDSIAFYVKKSVDLLEFTADTLRAMLVQQPGFPDFFAEVMMGTSWGNMREPGKGEKMSDFVHSLECSPKSEHSEKVNEAHTFILEIDADATRSFEQIQALKDLLMDNKGDNTIILKIGDKESPLPHKTSLGVADRDKILFLFGGQFYARL